ncbi:Hypothetical predicted protein, partial [Mytilus galloprovincialis]
MPLFQGKRKRGLVLLSNIRHRDHHIYLRKVYRRSKLQTPIYIRRNLFTQNHEIFETKKANIQNLLFTNIDESQDNLEEDHKEEHVLDNEEGIEEDHVVDHEKDLMEDIEEEYKVFESALDKLSDEKHIEPPKEALTELFLTTAPDPEKITTQECINNAVTVIQKVVN